MYLPLSDDGQVVLNTLVVDVLISLKVGHLDLAGRASGGLSKGAKGSLDSRSLTMWGRTKKDSDVSFLVARFPLAVSYDRGHRLSRVP